MKDGAVNYRVYQRPIAVTVGPPLASVNTLINVASRFAVNQPMRALWSCLRLESDADLLIDRKPIHRQDFLRMGGATCGTGAEWKKNAPSLLIKFRGLFRGPPVGGNVFRGANSVDEWLTIFEYLNEVFSTTCNDLLARCEKFIETFDQFHELSSREIKGDFP